jgi:hypothetical protein
VAAVGSPQPEPEPEAAGTEEHAARDAGDDGVVAAVLLEPEPDDAHRNNRSAQLRIYSGACDSCSQNANWELQIDGLGASDPQAVAASACPLGGDCTTSGDDDGTADGSKYIVAAIMGTEQVIVSFDNNATPSPLAGQVLHRRSSGNGAPAENIAVSADGSKVAVTDDAGVIVLGFTSETGNYSLIGDPIKP